MKVLGLIVGHSEESRGAVSYNGITEFDYNFLIANKVKDLLFDYNVITLVNTKHNLNYDHICLDYARYNVDLSIELHFNSFNKPARGLEALIVDNNSTFIADRFTSLLSEELGITERHKNGVLFIKEGDRGYVCLEPITNYAKHCLLIEPCFGNTKNEDSIKLFEPGGIDTYALALKDTIVECLSIANNDYVSILENENFKLRKIIADIKHLTSGH